MSYPQKTLPQLLHFAAVVHRSSPELCDITTGHCLQAPNCFPHSPNYEAERRYATKFGKKNQRVYFKERIPSIDQTDFSCCYELLVIRIHANHLWVSMTLCHINLSLTSKHPVTAYEWVTSWCKKEALSRSIEKELCALVYGTQGDSVSALADAWKTLRWSAPLSIRLFETCKCEIFAMLGRQCLGTWGWYKNE